METRIRPLSSPCEFGFVVFGRLTSGPFRICGAITMKMISSTSTTSTSGVMLMAACIRAGSPSRMGRAFFFDLRCLNFIHFVEFKPLELWYFEQAVHKLGRSPIHFDMESLKFAGEVVEGDDGRNCDEDTEGRRDQGLCDARRDHLRHVRIRVQPPGFDQILDISSVKELLELGLELYRLAEG